jgi:serine phosphatase RsbU (regulator of sigma subunit)
VQAENRALAVVGDVAGRGVTAATTMASLRFAVLAYAAEGAGPADVLTKLSHFAATNGHGSFATVLCAQLDVAALTVTLASAGHLPPLMVASGQADYLPLRVGVPIGVGGDVDYEQLTVAVPDGATLIAFTDGLVERRDEVLDDGLARLRETAAAHAHAPLEELLTALVTELTLDGHYEDDTAILAVRLTGEPARPCDYSVGPPRSSSM